LTLATRIVNGHTTPIEDSIPWNLLHAGKDVIIHKNTDEEFNREYTVTADKSNRGRTRKEYIILKDMDFHVMNKDNFMELVSE
jgi:hypothetical protein